MGIVASRSPLGVLCCFASLDGVPVNPAEMAQVLVDLKRQVHLPDRKAAHSAGPVEPDPGDGLRLLLQ